MGKARIALTSWVLPIGLSLSACQSNNINRTAAIDPADHTITVPPGSSLLLGLIKRDLTQAGWKLTVYQGPDVTVGTIGAKTNLASGNTFLTRYRLFIRQRQFDICTVPLGEAAVEYDLSVIDNRTGEEVLTQNGRSCVGNAAEKFEAALNAP